jgi:CheY-like chemotaxis protein
MKKTIVVVEDNQIVAAIYRSKLQAEGFLVEVAEDGQGGLEMIERVRPDLVLLDLVLPKLSGVEVLKQLRAQPDFQALPVIVFSSSYVSDEAWEAGATQVLNKASHCPKLVVEEVKTLLAATLTPLMPAKNSQLPKIMTSFPAKATVINLNEDERFQAEMRKTFHTDVPETVSALSASLQAFVKTPNDPAHSYDLYRKIHAVSGIAGLSGLRRIALLSAPLEAFFKELSANPKQINSSALRTAVQSIEFLILIFEQPSGGQSAELVTSFDALVVDGEELTRRAVSDALEKAELRCLRIADSQTALKVLGENQFNLLFIDIEMPELNGLELCLKLRELPMYKETPVVFMTSLSKFEQLTAIAERGENDMIVKPFHYTEAVTKALTLLLKSRT